jgi:crotonobetainyl-CoA:carnitine CoA-transferase CaiB-like acyl-CoA transferase
MMPSTGSLAGIKVVDLSSLILEVPELMNEPQVHHRHMVVEKDGYHGLGIPIKMSRTPGAVQMAPPRFGAHSRAILADNGFSPEEIEALIVEGIVLEQPHSDPGP